jgi:ribosomal protein S18 acetylase RimI-like enzyme
MMRALGALEYVRPCTEADDAFLYDVFCTTWEDEVAALPNPTLAQHVLRIQHIAQERRFATRYPHHQRFVVLEDGERTGRLYVHEVGSVVHIIDFTLLPAFRSQGIGTRIGRDLLAYAAAGGRSVTLRVARRHVRASHLYSSLGFQLVSTDDTDSYFEWTPARSGTSMAESALRPVRHAQTAGVLAQQQR